MKATPGWRLLWCTGGRQADQRSFACAAQKGFTVIELLVTVAIAAVLAVIAVPNFKRITLSNRLSTTANDVVLAVNTARMEAIKRNATTLLCSDGAVYVGSCNSSGTRVLASLNLGATIKASGGIVGLSFSPQGIARATAGTGAYAGNVADICTTGMSTDNHRVIAMVGGSIVTTTTSSGATCQ